MKLKIIAFFLCLTIVSIAQETKSALFLGNSYTYYNSLPQMVKQLAQADGNDLIYDSNTPGGYTFQGHSTNTTSLNKIKAQAWDFVVLQEQSQLPSFPPSQVQTDCYPYAAILNDSILANNPCTEPLFYMTWGRKNGDASFCGFYPPICTYDGMQERLTESYLELAEDNNASVAPVGVAWKQVRTLYPSINLYNPDESHPSLEGSYLAACVIYVSMFKQTVIGNTYISTLDSLTAFRLQTIASETVLDSIDLWHLLDNSLENNLAADTANCGINITLSLEGNYSALWNTGDTTLSIVCQNSGNYVFELSNPRSCSSIDSIQVTLNEISAIYIDVEACDSFVLNNNTFYADTSFTESFISAQGCDSIINYEIQIDTPVVTNAFFQQIYPVKSTGIIFGIGAAAADSLHILDSSFNLIYSTTNLFEEYTYYCPINFIYSTYYLIVFNSCKNDTLEIEATCGGLGAISELHNSWEVYPNPSKNQLIINNQEQTPFFVSIQDVLGRNIIQNNLLFSGYASIDVSHLDNGNYFLLLSNEEGFPIGKKLIQKE